MKSKKTENRGWVLTLVLTINFVIGGCAIRAPLTPFHGLFLIEKNQSRSGGVSEDNKQYTGYSSKPELDSLKEKVKSITSKEFASRIVSYSIQIAQNSIQAKLALRPRPTNETNANSEETVINFSGPLNLTQKPIISVLTPDEIHPENLKIRIECKDDLCVRSESLIYTDNHEIRSGILKNKERRQLRIRSSSLTSGPNSNRVAVVMIESTEIVPGRTTISVQGVDSALTLTMSLTVTDGECTPLEINLASLHLAPGTTCLMGNSESGDFVIKHTPQGELESIYIETVPRTPPQSDEGGRVDDSPGIPHITPCSFELQADAHELVRLLSRDCGRQELNDYIELWKGRGRNMLTSFLQLQVPSSEQRSLDFQTMLTILRQRRMPHILGIVTLQESNFTSDIVSSSGAGGYWQFMPATAADFGLRTFPPIPTDSRPRLTPEDERSQIVPSTNAAARFFEILLRTPAWRGNLKLSLAGYNCGGGCVSRRVRDLGDRLRDRQIPEYQNLTLEEIAQYSQDFWTLRHLHMLPAETQDYVPRIISAMIISLNPTRHEFDAPIFEQQ